MNFYLLHRLKLNGNYNPFQLIRNLKRREAFSDEIRIAIQLSFEKEIDDQFQIEIVSSECVIILLTVGNYLCQEIWVKYYNVGIQNL